MAFLAGRERVAVGLGPDRARMVVARGNGTLERLWSGSRDLPEGALRGGLRAPALREPDVVESALREMLDEARGDGLLQRRPELVSLVISDGSLKMAVAPLEGGAPSRADGDRMARWVLRDLLPVEPDAIRADWTLVQKTDDDAETTMMLSIGGDEILLQEYEALVGRLGWSVGRLVPWSFAAAAAGGEAVSHRLVLCDAEGTLAALFESDGVPRFHRSWRARIPFDRISRELPALRRYVNDHLETTIGDVRLCGGAPWADAAEAACLSAGLETHRLEPEDALLGSLST